MRARRLMVILALLAPGVLPSSTAQQVLELSDEVQVTALAVALTQAGDLVGASATISVSVASGGSGHVFIDTRPLAGTDMQGSARIAARVASAVTGIPLGTQDVFVVVRSDSPIISGPSAGGIMTLATVVALKNANLALGEAPWAIDERVMSTGTINPDGTIGPVGGILEKARAARDVGARLFLVPEGQGQFRPLDPTNPLAPGEPVNVSSYCQGELGITCQEVGTIEELVRLATGHAFEHNNTGPTPSTAEYNGTLDPLARELIDGALAYRQTWAAFNDSGLEAPPATAVQESLDAARDFGGQAQRHFEASEYYSAASRAFSSSIHGTHARLLLEFFEGGRSLDQLEMMLAEAADEVRGARRAAGGAEVTGMHTLYTVGAAQERVTDAESHLASAWERLNATDVQGALFDAAWAIERAETVHWWLQLSEPFGDGPPLPQSAEELADEFLELADETLAYAGSVLGAAQGPPRAAEKLAQAKADNRRGFHAAAVLEAAESQVLAALAIESAAGGPTQDAVNVSREKAVRAITEARERGVEPILAVTQFEFAGAQDDPRAALELYRTARVFAGISQVLTTSSDPTPSRFIGDWEDPGTRRAAIVGDVYRNIAVGWFIIGVLVTSAVGVLVAAVAKRD